MQYYVIGPDGNKYGPADVPTLKQWVAENRLQPDSMLEDFNSGQRMPAASVAGLFGDGTTATATAGPTMGPAGASPYSEAPKPTGTVYNPGATYDNGQSDLNLSWIFLVIGFCVCPIIFPILGIWKANEAMKKGHPSANIAKILNIVVLCLNILGVIFQIVMLASGASPFLRR